MAEERPAKRQKMERSGWVSSARVQAPALAEDLGLVTEEALQRQKESEVNPAEFSMKEDFKIFQVQGSVAGAGSGEFHTYRHTRRREMDRVARLEATAEQRRLEQEFQQQRARAEADSKLAQQKRAEKRNKRKQRQQEAKEQAKLEATLIAPNDGSFLARMLALQNEGKLEQLAAPNVPLQVVASEVALAAPAAGPAEAPNGEDSRENFAAAVADAPKSADLSGPESKKPEKPRAREEQQQE